MGRLVKVSLVHGHQIKPCDFEIDEVVHLGFDNLIVAVCLRLHKACEHEFKHMVSFEQGSNLINILCRGKVDGAWKSDLVYS